MFSNYFEILVTKLLIYKPGSPAVHEQAPLTKSILLAGPRGTGKKMLVHAICNETGATMFDISAANIAGKYPGKDGLKMLIHLIMKVITSCWCCVKNISIYIFVCFRNFCSRLIN